MVGFVAVPGGADPVVADKPRSLDHEALVRAPAVLDGDVLSLGAGDQLVQVLGVVRVAEDRRRGSPGRPTACAA
eukprot:8126834-Pyramimonas_sp.AAC.1